MMHGVSSTGSARQQQDAELLTEVFQVSTFKEILSTAILEGLMPNCTIAKSGARNIDESITNFPSTTSTFITVP